ncbi:MAG: hypothetical protein KAH21_13110, partial [Spirochaetaceae bacterium]|nr:hypothetical protein [Spirochaetaceae bacterium]
MPSNRCKRIKSFNRFLFLLIFLTIAGVLSGQNRIEWEAVEGAEYYLIEFRKNGALFLETRSEQPSLPLFLSPGDYEFQVKVINAFGKTSSQSEWSPLKISAPATPFIIDLFPREIHEGGKSTFTSRVSGLIISQEESTAFILENDEGKQVDLEIAAPPAGTDQGSSWEQITLELSRKAPETGSWTLIMTNPDGRESRMNNALSVLERMRPKIRKVNPKEMASGNNSNVFTIEINGMEEGALIEINGPSIIPATLLKISEDGVLEYSLNLENAEPGWYALVVTNPSEGFDVKERAFEILPPPPSPEEAAAATALEIDKKDPRPIPDYPRSIFGGWHFDFPLNTAGESYDNSYAGFTLGYSQNFSNDLIRRIPGFNGLSWDITYSYTNNVSFFPLMIIHLNRSDFLLGLNYVTPFNFPVNLLLKASLGMGFSIYTSPEHDRDEWLGSFSLRDLDSLDFITRFGAGARFDINPRWYINLSCD